MKQTKSQLYKIGTLFNEDFYIDATDDDAIDRAREYFNGRKEEVNDIAAITLLKYFKWCEEHGIAKNTILLFARENGIL